jgi:cytochrome c biogenesis protein CcdA/thiol-disulfide isomerase/thioredoxin
MILLITFAFLAGVVTVLSPCILPLLPIILSSSADTSGKKRPLGVVVGFVVSFTFFTLFLASIVRATGVTADTLRFISIAVLAVFGVSLLVPKVQLLIEQLFSRLTRFVPQNQGKTGFFGGLIIGLSLGLLWTPCVGPILASVISIALSGSINAQAVIITLSYSVGTAIPMFIIMLAGSTALQKVPWLVRNTPRIQKAFGVLMILTAVGIFFNIDRRFQTFILETFPQYGVGLTQFEDNQNIRKELQKVNEKPVDENMLGKPMLDTPKGVVAPEIIPGGEWFNSKPIALSQLKGKVVLIDFWTYSCINCQRTLPYLRDWWQKYKDQGLVIIGVHSPEFEFEKDATNVSEAIKDFKLEYPIVQDNNFATWRAYQNRYWPAKYFIDKDGYIRWQHFGEGAYDESERLIQELLRESGSEVMPSDISNPEYQIYSKTPEIYLGQARYNGQQYVELEGDWISSQEYSNPQKGSKLYLNFESKEVFLVMRPKQDIAKVKVYLDDKVQYLGEDNINGVVTVDKDRLYKLIKLNVVGKHILRLEFEDNNAEVYAFTFG